MRGLVYFLAAGCALAAAPGVPGDSERGQAILTSHNCIVCHSVNGAGASSAPDLGRSDGRSYTPARMAGVLWNHAPEMWTAMKRKGVESRPLSRAAAADLFAYFHAARYFEKRGDAHRGKRLFANKGCAECHSLSAAPGPDDPRPVSAWHWLNDPIGLAAQMWNHSPRMVRAFREKGLTYPELTAAELNDLLVYLQNLPETRGRKPEFAAASPSTGEDLFQAKGCNTCHAVEKLAAGGSRRTLADFAVSMWNHAPRMGKPMPQLSAMEMRRVAGYLWSAQVFAEPGDAARGRRLFAAKNCAACHEANGGAPELAGLAGRFDAYAMVESLWLHGPAMLSAMQAKKVDWPRFAETEVADLIAYLNRPAKP